MKNKPSQTDGVIQLKETLENLQHNIFYENTSEWKSFCTWSVQFVYCKVEIPHKHTFPFKKPFINE